MIAHTTWRDLFYKLAEAHPDCLMLNFTVKVGEFWSCPGQSCGRASPALWKALPSLPCEVLHCCVV